MWFIFFLVDFPIFIQLLRLLGLKPIANKMNDHLAFKAMD